MSPNIKKKKWLWRSWQMCLARMQCCGHPAVTPRNHGWPLPQVLCLSTSLSLCAVICISELLNKYPPMAPSSCHPLWPHAHLPLKAAKGNSMHVVKTSPNVTKWRQGSEVETILVSELGNKYASERMKAEPALPIILGYYPNQAFSCCFH